MAGGYVGEIQEKFTQQIFDALDAGTPITIKLTYDLGERETLVMTARGGVTNGITLHDLFHASNAPAHVCLGYLEPPTGTTKALVQLPHAGS